MRFETSQQMKLGQQMKLAPRMIQSMEILQMPLAELEERLEQELESNPTLELAEETGEPVESPQGEDPGADDLEFSNGLAEVGADDGDDFERLDDFEASNPEAAANEREGGEIERFRDRFESLSGGDPDAKLGAMAQAPSGGPSMHEQLLEQWAIADVRRELRRPGEAIIGALDSDGYLRVELAELASEHRFDPELTEIALSAVQALLEPSGVAARDARECLLLQLDAQTDRPADQRVAPDRAIALAQRIADRHLEDLSKNRLPKIAEALEVSLDGVKEGVEALRRLSRAPGRALSNESATPVYPDAVVEYLEEEDRYIAYPTDPRLGNMRISREYALMSKDRATPKPDRDFLKKSLSNAQWLLDAVEQRRSTLMRVIAVVLEEQREALDFGPESIKPLPMTSVADRLGVHVATVSRAVADKRLLTPRGVVSLRDFFTGGMATESGEEVSANEIRGALREIVDGEDKAKPLSDEALSKALKERGYEVARRTVAKYRGQLDIPSARMRKEF